MAELTQDEKDIQEAMAAGGQLVAAPGPLMKKYSAPPDAGQRPAGTNPNGPLPWLVAGAAKTGEFAGNLAMRHPLEIAAALYGANKLRGLFPLGRGAAAPAAATAVAPPQGPPPFVTSPTGLEPSTGLSNVTVTQPQGAPGPYPVPSAPAGPPGPAEAAAAERAMASAPPEAPAGATRPGMLYGRPGGPVPMQIPEGAEGASGPELARRAAAFERATGRPLSSLLGGAAAFAPQAISSLLSLDPEYGRMKAQDALVREAQDFYGPHVWNAARTGDAQRALVLSYAHRFHPDMVARPYAIPPGGY